MYICICQAVTERQIREAVANGVTTFEQLQLELGVGCSCGTCLHRARGAFHEARASGLPPMPRGATIDGPSAA